MAVIFSHTTRSLAADRFRHPGLIAAGLLIFTGLWALWFVAAPIAIYATTDRAALAGGARISALFAPQEALGRIAVGQQAHLRLAGFAGGAVPASVTHIAPELEDGAVRVELAVDPAFGGLGQLPQGLPGQLAINVEQATPATLLLRAAGYRPAASPGTSP